MRGGAHAAHATYKGPGVAGVAPFQYGFNAANHGACTEGIRNLTIIHFNFNPQVSFNPGDGIYNDSFSHGYNTLGVSVSGVVSGALVISLCLRTLVTMA